MNKTPTNCLLLPLPRYKMQPLGAVRVEICSSPKNLPAHDDVPAAVYCFCFALRYCPTCRLHALALAL